tara:strand:+ start:3502 stop:4551 length:1050 start_codon:yes stop_codon:yes gene_type:complete
MKTLHTLILMLLASTLSAQSIKVGYTDYNSEFDLDVWSMVAKDMGAEYELTRVDSLNTLLKDTQAGVYDVALGGISITSEREKLVDFSKPYLNAGLRVMFKDSNKQETVAESIFNLTFVKQFASSMFSNEVLVIGFWYIIFILIMAHIVWISEMGDNSIDDRWYIGVPQAAYFCIVTSSTVGYGDFTCKKIVGRISALFLIVVGVAFFANLNGRITADNVVRQITTNYITGVDDLKDGIVGTKDGQNTSVEALEELGITHTKFRGDTWHTEAVRALRDGKIDAIVYDSPLIDKIAKENVDLITLDKLYFPQYYGIVLKDNSEYEERINVSLLRLLESPVYNKLIERHYQ